GGATRLAVALVEEGAVLRDAGIGAPIHLLSEPPAEAASEIVKLGLTPTVYSRAFVDALLVVAAGDVAVHLKVDTGMHRVGALPEDAVAVADAIRPPLRLEGVWTHLAVA